MIEISSYEGAGLIRFGMSQAEIVKVLGDPIHSAKDRRGNTVLRYAGKSITVGSEGVAEIGLLPECSAEVAGVRIFSDNDALLKLCRIDGDPKEVLGFVVLLNIGITMTGFHDGDESQKAVTVFSRGRWDILRSEMKPLEMMGRSGA